MSFHSQYALLCCAHFRFYLLYIRLIPQSKAKQNKNNKRTKQAGVFWFSARIHSHINAVLTKNSRNKNNRRYFKKIFDFRSNEIKAQKYSLSQGCCWPIETMCNGVAFIWGQINGIYHRTQGAHFVTPDFVQIFEFVLFADEEYELSSHGFRTVTGRATFRFSFSP